MIKSDYEKMTSADIPLIDLLTQVRQCRVCEPHLPLGARPVVRLQSSARILIIGQAPGTRVHASGIPWDDPSGDRLRQWMGLDKVEFYDEKQIAIMPMGFCYPGKGKSGDLPPRPECAIQWHEKLLQHLPNRQLTLLIGQYSQQYYLPDDTLKRLPTLTARVAAWDKMPQGILPLVHPSPRNQLWLKRNPWFERDCIPQLQQQIADALAR